MKLTPLEIRKQEFRKGLRGLDQVEVQTFLEMVAEQYEELLEENKALNRRIIEMETKLHSYQENERTLRETLLNVQEVKKQSEESSRRKADFVVKEAELKALEISESVKKQSRQIREEINWLKSQKESFINRLRHILISQIELLSVMELDDIIPEETKELLNKGKSRKIIHPDKSEKGKNTFENLDDHFEIEAEAPPLQDMNIDTSGEQIKQREERVIRQMGDEKEKISPKTKTPPQKDASLSEEDINDFFKKGLQIDDLIKTINKKDVGK